MTGITVMDNFPIPEGGALKLVGGFDEYQEIMRAGVLEALEGMSDEDIGQFDEWLVQEGRNTGALERGLRGLKTGEVSKPITNDNRELLEGSLAISFLSRMQQVLEPHLTKGTPGTPLGLLPDESGEGLDLRSEEFMVLGIRAMQESDDVIAQMEEQEQG